MGIAIFGTIMLRWGHDDCDRNERNTVSHMVYL